MALILDVLDARTRALRMRIRLDDAPSLTIGRGLDNDLILDDPYVDACHVRIAVDGEHGLVVEDLGSVNGLVDPAGGRRFARLPAAPGAEMRIGRTLLRFRDPAEPVPPALPESAASSSRPRWPAMARGRLAVPAAAACAIAATTWLGRFERSSASDAVAAALAFAVTAALWAGIWAVAGRVAVQRFQFLGHLAVISAITLAGMSYSVANGWLVFLFPDNPLAVPAGFVVFVALVASAVAAHLALASTLPRRRRWRAGIATAGVLLALGGLVALAEGDTFSDVPEFPAVLKPVAGRWLPAKSVAEFGTVVAGLKDQVDDLVDDGPESGRVGEQ